MIGLDIGTTGAKAVALDPDGKELSRARVSYATMIPAPGWAEQDPDAVVDASLQAVRQCVDALGKHRARVAGISLSSAWHSLILLRKQGPRFAAATSSITWADLRATEQTQVLKTQLDPLDVYMRTGCPLHPMYWPAKIRWLEDTLNKGITRRPAQAANIRFVSIKEYLLYRLFGVFVVDKSVASGTGLFNLESSSWDETLMEALNVEPVSLSEVVPTTHVLTGLDREAADAMGLSASTPVVVGSGDGALSSLGVGGMEEGVFTVMVGGSGAVRTASKAPLRDRKMRTYCYHLTEGYYLPGGAINNGAIALEWYGREFLGLQSGGLRNIDALLERVPAGSGGLLFLPFMAGERSPSWNPHMRGIIQGLDLSHTPYHVFRALAEGICFRLKTVFEALSEVAGAPSEVRVSSGLMSSFGFRQMMCDVLGVELSIPATEENSAAGAALLGFVALGTLPDAAEASRRVPVVDKVVPKAGAARLYAEVFQRYKQFYEANAPLYGF